MIKRQLKTLLQWHFLNVFLNPWVKEITKTKFTKCILKIKRFVLERAKDLLRGNLIDLSIIIINK